ncbi:MAG: hypothetical protein ACLFUJ_14030 [Phycisphaerae bacterium]
MAQSLPIVYNQSLSAEMAGKHHDRRGQTASTGLPRRDRVRVRTSSLARREGQIVTTRPAACYYRLPDGYVGRAIGTYLHHRDLETPSSTVTWTA